MSNLESSFNKPSMLQLRDVEEKGEMVLRSSEEKGMKIRSHTSETHFIYNTTVVSDPKTPTNFKEVMESKGKKKWLASMKDEIMNFVKRGSWRKIERKKVQGMGIKVIRVKKVFKVKIEQDMSHRYKTRDVVKGFMKIHGIDFTEYYTPVERDTTIRTVCAFTLSDPKWMIEMVDVEAAFLNLNVGTC